MKLTSCVTRPLSNYHTWTYPCLGTMKPDKTVIVLFHSSRSGVVIATEGYAFRVGNNVNNWDMDQFEPFYGSVTISSSPDKVEGATGAVGHV